MRIITVQLYVLPAAEARTCRLAGQAHAAPTHAQLEPQTLTTAVQRRVCLVRLARMNLQEASDCAPHLCVLLARLMQTTAVQRRVLAAVEARTCLLAVLGSAVPSLAPWEPLTGTTRARLAVQRAMLGRLCPAGALDCAACSCAMLVRLMGTTTAPPAARRAWGRGCLCHLAAQGRAVRTRALLGHQTLTTAVRHPVYRVHLARMSPLAVLEHAQPLSALRGSLILILTVLHHVFLVKVVALLARELQSALTDLLVRHSNTSLLHSQ